MIFVTNEVGLTDVLIDTLEDINQNQVSVPPFILGVLQQMSSHASGEAPSAQDEAEATTENHEASAAANRKVCRDSGSTPVANGVAIDTSSVGQNTFTVTATDNAGNVTVKTVTYTVTMVNNGETPYTGAVVTNSLAGLVDHPTYNTDAAMTIGTGVLLFTSPNLTWTGNLAVGATATCTANTLACAPNCTSNMPMARQRKWLPARAGKPPPAPRSRPTSSKAKLTTPASSAPIGPRPAATTSTGITSSSAPTKCIRSCKRTRARPWPPFRNSRRG